MLVLSRKRGERIVIGQNIELTVVEVRGGKVRLGFTAPSGVPIHREEVYRRIGADGGMQKLGSCDELDFRPGGTGCSV
jgi:carbon storage regulator